MQIFEQSEETGRIKDFLATANPGDVLTYAAIEDATCVVMDDVGKGKLRRALHALRLDYDCEPSVGITLASHVNGMRIVGGKLERVRSAIGRAEKSSRRVHQRFFELMSPEDQRRSIFVGAAFSAMNEAAKRVRYDDANSPTNTTLVIPPQPPVGT